MRLLDKVMLHLLEFLGIAARQLPPRLVKGCTARLLTVQSAVDVRRITLCVLQETVHRTCVRGDLVTAVGSTPDIPGVACDGAGDSVAFIFTRECANTPYGAAFTNWPCPYWRNIESVTLSGRFRLST